MTFTRLWFALIMIGAIPLILDAILPGIGVLSLIWAGLLLLATLTDYLLLSSPQAIEVERVMEPQLSLGAPNLIRLFIRNRSDRPWKVVIHDEPPAHMEADFAMSRPSFDGHQSKSIEYHTTPKSRGDFHFGDVWLRVRGRLNLVNRQRRLPLAAPVKVYPNMLETAKFTLMAKRGRLQQVGIRAARLIGAGREFESLREYQPDDDYRRIDWKATARRGKLISRQYEVERSQNVVLVVDVGRTMIAEIDGIAKMDYAVNAALLLAYVATLADDKVASWSSPIRSRPGYRPERAVARFTAYWRRSTTPTPPAPSRTIRAPSPTWPPAGARGRWSSASPTSGTPTPPARPWPSSPASSPPPRGLRNADGHKGPALPGNSLTEPQNAFEQAVAIEVLDDRARATAELKRRGVLVVDTPAEKLSAALVNRYLEVKEKMML